MHPRKRSNSKANSNDSVNKSKGRPKNFLLRSFQYQLKTNDRKTNKEESKDDTSMVWNQDDEDEHEMEEVMRKKRKKALEEIEKEKEALSDQIYSDSYESSDNTETDTDSDSEEDSDPSEGESSELGKSDNRKNELNCAEDINKGKVEKPGPSRERKCQEPVVPHTPSSPGKGWANDLEKYQRIPTI